MEQEGRPRPLVETKMMKTIEYEFRYYQGAGRGT
jgi:hypothetical protein